MADIVVLENALRHIRDYPEQHDQSVWMQGGGEEGITCHFDNGDNPECGTTLCLAGWIGFLYAPRGAKLKSDHVVLPDGTRTYIETWAAHMAELDSGQADALFINASTADDLARAIEVLARNPHATKYDLTDVMQDGDPDEDDECDCESCREDRGED